MNFFIHITRKEIRIKHSTMFHKKVQEGRKEAWFLQRRGTGSALRFLTKRGLDGMMGLVFWDVIRLG
jgi:hypothetical protein